jgi:hypothetical protein
VNRQITIRWLLAITVIAGLALAPFSRPVMAETSPDGSMSAMVHRAASTLAVQDMTVQDMAAEDMTASMVVGMPCCPSQAPVPVDCNKCLSMAACVSKCFAGLFASGALPVFSASGTIASLANDVWPSGMGHPPPEHPPRTLVSSAF